MNAKQITFTLPGKGPAILTLPQPLTPETLMELELSVTQALRNLQHESGDDALAPGHIEYASWLQRLAAMAH